MAVVVSAGRLMGLDRPTPPRVGNLRLDLSYSADYATIWKTQPHVRTVVGFLARNIAQIGLHTFERTSDTDRRRLAASDHPLAALIARPNARTTRYRLIDALVNDLGIYDVACWVKLGQDGSVDGLLRLPPPQIEPLGDSWMWSEGIRFRGNRGRTDFTPDQVVLFHGYNPSDSRWGVSPMETLRQILAEEHQATRYREQLWRNGARFPGYIKRPKEAGDWSDAARERFRTDWRGLYTGDGPAAGGTPVLEDGMEFVGGGITPAQAQYLETRKLTREEVAAAFHIPLPMVGILDHATFSNIEEQHKNLYQDTLGPWLEMIQQEIGLQLVPDFDNTGKVYVEFNLAEKMKGSFEEQAGSLQTSVGAPWLTRNEARARMNLPQIEGGDALVVPLNVLTGGQASPTDSGTQNESPKSTPDPIARELAKAQRVASKAVTAAQRKKIGEVLRDFFDRQGKAVLSRIGAGQEWWDGDRWDKELADDLTGVAHTIASLLGAKEAGRLGFEDGYDPDLTVNFLRKVAQNRAAGINATTKAQLDEAVADGQADPAVVFETAKNSRADVSAVAIGTFVAGFAAVEAARQIARTEGVEPTKTWITGSNPRPEHASLDGETVPVDEVFSNGMSWPGEGGPEDAGCNCSVEVNVS